MNNGESYEENVVITVAMAGTTQTSATFAIDQDEEIVQYFNLNAVCTGSVVFISLDCYGSLILTYLILLAILDSTFQISKINHVFDWGTMAPDIFAIVIT